MYTTCDSQLGFVFARNQFRALRKRALWQTLRLRLSGKSNTLISLKSNAQQAPRTLQDVPLEAICGSVNRADDYTATFLPKREHDEERWARVYMAMSERGVPPLELLEHNGKYYVLDGHNRVSILRHWGAKTAEAYVSRAWMPARATPQRTPQRYAAPACVSFRDKLNYGTYQPTRCGDGC
jgi:hypothetical protein